MSNEMIERVARALCAKKLWQGAFDQETDDNRDEWRMLARAAIDAIREPTEAMLEAAFVADYTIDASGHGKYSAQWQAMLDEALK